MKDTEKEWLPPFLAETLLIGMVVIVIGECILFEKLSHRLDKESVSAPARSPPPPNSGEEVLVVGSTMLGVDNLHYYPRL